MINLTLGRAHILAGDKSTHSLTCIAPADGEIVRLEMDAVPDRIPRGAFHTWLQARGRMGRADRPGFRGPWPGRPSWAADFRGEWR